MLSSLNRLTSHIQSNDHRLSKTLLTIRSLSTLKRHPNPNLYTTINSLYGNPNRSVVPKLDQWVETGRKVQVSDLQRIIRNLRRRGRYSQALQVSEWMENQGICSLPSDHAVRLDLIGHVHGVESAETYFNSMRDPDRTVKAYGALLNCYVRAGSTIKSLSLVQKMKDMGFLLSHLVYNDLMCLYTKISEHEKVPRLLAEMKANNVSPNNFSYRICLNSYGVRSDIESMERLLEQMENDSDISMDWTTYSVVANHYIKAGLPDKAKVALEKSEQLLSKADGPGYAHLITLHSSLQNKGCMLRLWHLKKTALNRHTNMDYAVMLGSLLKLGEFEEAETLMEMYESSGNNYDFRVPNVLLLGYSQNGEAEKAEAMLRGLVEKGRVAIPSSWSIVAAGYARKNEMTKAVECMKRALTISVDEHCDWSPALDAIASMLHWLGDEGTIDEVEAFVELLKSRIPMNRDMYYALINANVKVGREVDDLVERMKVDKIDVDEKIENERANLYR
ncbi:hypothetical protein Sjap_025657 [Stephania japonica]|uniref:Pentatricopeptide repeat-containing protein n=1 Tax=Stephania japonica TaxID=461633 RepID=A0AAP0HI58_9MAGN